MPDPGSGTLQPQEPVSPEPFDASDPHALPFPPPTGEHSLQLPGPLWPNSPVQVSADPDSKTVIANHDFGGPAGNGEGTTTDTDRSQGGIAEALWPGHPHLTAGQMAQHVYDPYAAPQMIKYLDYHAHQAAAEQWAAQQAQHDTAPGGPFHFDTEGVGRMVAHVGISQAELHSGQLQPSQSPPDRQPGYTPPGHEFAAHSHSATVSGNPGMSGNAAAGLPEPGIHHHEMTTDSSQHVGIDPASQPSGASDVGLPGADFGAAHEVGPSH